ncbi:unnamed protein product, partial [Rotaria sp. Silwood1]
MDLFGDHIGMESNFQKYSTAQADTQNTPYDYDSIMHYPRDAFSVNGQDTIRPLQAGVTIGNRQTLSVIDIEEVQLAYGCSATGPISPPT